MTTTAIEVNWKPYKKDLNKMFSNATFNYIERMGFPIWGRGNEDGSYDKVLTKIHKSWKKLTPKEKAQVLLSADSDLTEVDLAKLCLNKDYNHFQ